MWCDECGRPATFTHGLANGQRFDVIDLCDEHRGDLRRIRDRIVRDAHRAQRRARAEQIIENTLTTGARTS